MGSVATLTSVGSPEAQRARHGQTTVALVSLGHGLRTIHGATWAGPTTGTSEGDTVLTFEEFQNNLNAVVVNDLERD